MPKKFEHEIHKYKRMTVGRKDHAIYKCMLPNCSHYLPFVELAIGRLTLCWGCNTVLEITQEMVSRYKTERPMCAKCKAERAERRLALASIPLESSEETEEEDYGC